MGEHNGVALGSRLPKEFAQQELANYLTPGIRRVVSDELATASDSQLYSKPRIYNDLLSSQPLCFNLFGEMKLDLDLATKVMGYLRPGTISAVTHIGFEFSPERSSDRFTNDRSAFDVFVEYDSIKGGKGFLGIEVKYHENLQDPVATHRARYDEVASVMGCFSPASLGRLQQAPLQQLWRDHLLAGSMLNDSGLGYTEGCFIVLYPAGNSHCRSAVYEYRKCLGENSTFDAWTLEEVIAVLNLCTEDKWVRDFHQRYLDFRYLSS